MINFKTSISSRSAQKRVRYIITIDDQERPAYAARELDDGVITVMIDARTPEEAERIRRQSEAAIQSVVSTMPLPKNKNLKSKH